MYVLFDCSKISGSDKSTIVMEMKLIVIRETVIIIIACAHYIGVSAHLILVTFLEGATLKGSRSKKVQTKGIL